MGATYEEIARAGGGIKTTMRATREASEDELFGSALSRVSRFSEEGVTTLEVKSGYGLDLECELRMLRVARRLGRLSGVDVQATLLAAHVLPPEYSDDRAGYLDLICGEILPHAVAEGLADAVDAFCDEIAFTPAECERVLTAGAEAGLPCRLHADQLTDQGGAGLAARLGARTADHLEWTSREGAEAMARAGTVAVLLPGAFYFLKATHAPPVDHFRDAGVAMAVASDLNPGSSPVNSILLTMSLSCVLFGLTPEEAFRGVTVNGARALGMDDLIGTVEEGKQADLAIWNVNHPRELTYWIGTNPCEGVVKGGMPLKPGRIA
jgi:imidazolonepropionase